ncbi:MAG TPA: hypothetical protein VIE42_14705 [Steroidobacteraceae bacterium]
MSGTGAIFKAAPDPRCVAVAIIAVAFVAVAVAVSVRPGTREGSGQNDRKAGSHDSRSAKKTSEIHLSLPVPDERIFHAELLLVVGVAPV